MRYVIMMASTPLALSDFVARAPEMKWSATPTALEPQKNEFEGIANDKPVRIWPFDRDDFDWSDEPEQLARIRALGPKQQAYFVHFHDAAQLKLVLKRIANSPNVLIDDDYGLLVSGDEFVQLCETASGNWLMNGDFG